MKPSEFNRQERLKELVFLQAKLAVDALVDFLLSPVVLFCGLIDIVQANAAETSLLGRLKAAGLRYEHWLRLFGEAGETSRAEGAGADRLLRHVELRARRHLRKTRRKSATPGA